MSAALRIEGVVKRFGALVALNDVSLGIGEGELVALIGPNGSGKTTLLNLLTGHLHPDVGTISLRGARIDARKPEQIARLGMVRMFQITRLFLQLSVMDNLLVSGLALGRSRPDAETRARFLLDRLALGTFATASASALSGGQKKLLEFAACFMGESTVVLLDEPFSAIAVAMKDTMIGFIRERHAAGDTLLVVSHDMPVVAELCPRTICMNAGTTLADGDTATVLRDARVIEAYLGDEE